MMNEKFKFSESMQLDNGKLIMSNHASGRIVGELEIKGFDQTGRMLFKRVEHNDVILPGSIFILEQMFKKKAADRRLHPVSMNTGIAQFGTVNLTSSWTEPEKINDEFVFGFMAGNGGASVTGAHPVRYSATSLIDGSGNASFLPFRIINASLAQPTNYGLPVLNNGNYMYFAKKFSTDPSIVIADNTAYAQMQLDITAQEFREYFTLGGITENAGINQIGLVAGLHNVSAGTYDDVKLITTANFTTIDLTEDTSFTITYKIYCL